MKEGYIKFNCKLIESKPFPLANLAQMNNWRDKLYSLNLIGANKEGIGFGNLSTRFEGNTFLITGSATGNFVKLNEDHYVLVKDYNFAKNSLICEGPIKASSESLSHAAVYESSQEINAVIHVHNLNLWKKLINKFPTTDMNAQYGTPEMANESKRLFRESNALERKIIIMGGHKEGIISFGKNLEEAGNILLEEYQSQ
jgi:ribulose-5-phosphate 4-epimerase/fuculose-1-phosphate aldolase